MASCKKPLGCASSTWVPLSDAKKHIRNHWTAPNESETLVPFLFPILDHFARHVWVPRSKRVWKQRTILRSNNTKGAATLATHQPPHPNTTNQTASQRTSLYLLPYASYSASFPFIRDGSQSKSHRHNKHPASTGTRHQKKEA